MCAISFYPTRTLLRVLGLTLMDEEFDLKAYDATPAKRGKKTQIQVHLSLQIYHWRRWSSSVKIPQRP